MHKSRSAQTALPLPGGSTGNHMDVTAACDFFVVPTATFKVLYVFVVLSHASGLDGEREVVRQLETERAGDQRLGVEALER